MVTCTSCGGEINASCRFCPACGTPLRLKLVDHFRGVDELGDGWLRVSVYLANPQHVRFSLWRDDRIQSATSLSPEEAQRLARFLSGLTLRTEPKPLRRATAAVRNKLRERAR